MSEDEVPPCRSCGEAKEIFCRTGMSVNSYRIQWAVDNFSFYQQGQKECVDSDSFTTGSRSKLKWKLRIYPNTVQSGVSYVFIRLVPLFFTETPIRFSLAILDKDKQKRNLIETELKIYSRERASESFRLIERKSLIECKQDLLQNDSLTILCELKVAEKLVRTMNTYNQNNFTNTNELSTCLMNIFESSKFSDVTISVRDTEFHVHKVVLSARSKVFEAMFEHEMNESKSNFIKIIDTYPKVMCEVLRYMYTGKFRGLKSMAAEVLPVADKYNLETLKHMCEEALVTQLSLERAVTTLEQADAHNLKNLKMITIQFMNTHRDEILKSEAWKKLVNTRPDLAVEVFTVIFEGNIQLQSDGSGMVFSFRSIKSWPIVLFAILSWWSWYYEILW